ncbi:MAG: methylated-DNA--[protein]-cysteine S-methyltransferase [Micropepsaceae bacterium]
MSGIAYAQFDTPIGACAILWRGDRIVGTALPAAITERLADLVRRRHPRATEAAPPPFVTTAIEAIVALLSGEALDLMDVPLDFTGIGDFERRVYALARGIPPGETRTYGDLAREIGDIALSRGVGQALGRNPFPIVVPCHRILASGGKTGGFSAPGGIDTKFRILEIERTHSPAPSLFGEAGGLAFAPRR